MQAALGLAQLERIEELVVRKREIFSWYRDELANIPGVVMNSEAPGTKNTYWMVSIVTDPRLRLTKQFWMEHLPEHGIDCRPFFHPLSSIPAYRDAPGAKAAAARNVVSYELSPHGINLPSALSLDRPTVKRVCDVVRAAIEKASA